MRRLWIVARRRASGRGAPEPTKFAVLVDAENARPASLASIMAEIATFGETSIRRCYGDFTKQQLAPWKDVALALSFKRVNADCYSKGKNSSDSQMIIEAMDFLYTAPALGGFCLVSSDADFTGLAQRLREASKTVIGFGVRRTPAPFVTACDRFIHVENLEPRRGGDDDDVSGRASNDATRPGGSAAAAAAATVVVARDDPALLELLNTAVDARADDSGWARLGDVGSTLVALKSDFDTRTYGCGKLYTLFVEHFAPAFEVKLVPVSSTNAQTNPCVRRRVLLPAE